MKHIFISHSSKDKDMADEVCSLFENNGLACWIAPRDIPGGKEYGEEVILGIDACFAMVVVLTDNSNDSKMVAKEVERAISKNKDVITVKMKDIQPSKRLELFISSSQSVQAWNSSLEVEINKLAKESKASIERNKLPEKVSPVRIFPTLQKPKNPGGAWVAMEDEQLREEGALEHLTVQEAAIKFQVLMSHRRLDAEYRKYLPRPGTEFHDYGIQEGLLRHGYVGGVRNYADLTGYVIVLEGDPENLFYLRQDLKGKEWLPMIVSNTQPRPKHADFITVAAGIFAFSKEGYGSSILMPIVSKWGIPPATKSPPLPPEAFLDEKLRMSYIQEKKLSKWNYVVLAGAVIKCELITIPEQKNQWLRVILQQTEFPDSDLVLYYAQPDAALIKESCPTGSLISMRARYGSRMVEGQLTPTIYIETIRGVARNSMIFLMANDSSRMPRWLKALANSRITIPTPAELEIDE